MGGLPAAGSIAPPRLLAGRYEVGEVIGEGGMAMVHAGWDRLLRRPVAIKTLSPYQANRPEVVERFRREARAAALLSHPNVVGVFDTGSEDGLHYIVMELVEGRTLSDEILENGPLEPDRARRIAAEIARGLAAAHEQGVVHRDVKPGNVMLTEEGRVKVMDFGIARAVDDDSRTAVVLGTACYLSPEQARGERAGPPSDVYSLGCLLYELLAGRPPFTGQSPVALAYKHVHEEPPPLRTIRDGAGEDLEAIVHRAIQKDPARRFADAAGMERALAGLTRTVELPPVEQGPRHRLPLSWAAAALLTMLVTLAVLLIPALLGGDAPERGHTAEEPAKRAPGGAAVEPTPDQEDAAHTHAEEPEGRPRGEKETRESGGAEETAPVEDEDQMPSPDPIPTLSPTPPPSPTPSPTPTEDPSPRP